MYNPKFVNVSFPKDKLSLYTDIDAKGLSTDLQQKINAGLKRRQSYDLKTLDIQKLNKTQRIEIAQSILQWLKQN